MHVAVARVAEDHDLETALPRDQAEAAEVHAELGGRDAAVFHDLERPHVIGQRGQDRAREVPQLPEPADRVRVVGEAG